MERSEENDRPGLRLNVEGADYFIAHARLTAAQLRLSAQAYELGIFVVMFILLFCVFQLFCGNMGVIGPIAICVFWIGFFACRVVERRRDAKKMDGVVDRLLKEIGKNEIRRALEEDDDE